MDKHAILDAPPNKNKKMEKRKVAAKKKRGEKKIKELAKQNMNFTKWQEETIMNVEEIHKQQQTHLIAKMRNKLISKNRNLPNSIDGSIIGQYHQSKEVRKLVSLLKRDPLSSVSRLKLITLIQGLESELDFNLNIYEDIAKQAMLPLYIGDLTPGTVHMVIRTYRTYLDRLVYFNKKRLLTVKSSQLKRANLEMIKFREGIDEHSPQEKFLMGEIQVATELLDRSSDLMASLKSKMTISLHTSELDELDSTRKALNDAFVGGAGEDEANTNKKKRIVLRKALSIIDLIKHVPTLHSLGLKLADSLKRVDSKLNYAYVLEGRVHMQAMQFYLVWIETGEYSFRDKLLPTYKKAVGAYKKAMNLTTTSTTTKADLPILMEFALVTHYGYIHRDLMRITEDGVMGLLRQGQEAIQAAVLVEPELVRVQNRIENAIQTLREGTPIASE